MELLQEEPGFLAVFSLYLFIGAGLIISSISRWILLGLVVAAVVWEVASRVFSKEQANEQEEESTERRQFERHARVLDANWEGESQDVARFVRVWDISRGGVRLSVREKLEVDAVLTVKIYDVRGEYLAATLRIVHVQERDSGWSLGCEFQTPLSEEQLNFLIY